MSTAATADVEFNIFTTDNATPGLRGVGTAMENVKTKTGNADAKLLLFGDRMLDIAKQALQTFVVKVGEAVTAVFDFQEVTQNTATLMPGQATNVGILEQGFLDLAGEAGSAIELMEKAYQGISSGSADPIDALERVGNAAKFATGNAAALDDSVELLNTTMNVFGTEAGTANDIMDKLTVIIRQGSTDGKQMAGSLGGVFSTFKAAGGTFDELGSIMIAATRAGINTASAVSSVKAAVSNILKPTKEAIIASKGLEGGFGMQAIKAKGLIPFLKDLAEFTGDNAEKQAALFGSVEAFNLIAAVTSESGLKTLAEAEQSLANSSGAMLDAFETRMNTMPKQVEAFKNSVEGSFIRTVLPAMKLLTDAFKNIRPEAEAFVNILLKELSGPILEVAKNIIDLTDALRTLFKDEELDAEYLGKLISFMWIQPISSFIKFLKNATETVTIFFDQVTKEASEIFYNAIRLINYVNSAYTVASEALSSVSDTISKKLKAIADVIKIYYDAIIKIASIKIKNIKIFGINIGEQLNDIFEIAQDTTGSIFDLGEKIGGMGSAAAAIDMGNAKKEIKETSDKSIILDHSFDGLIGHLDGFIKGAQTGAPKIETLGKSTKVMSDSVATAVINFKGLSRVTIDFNQGLNDGIDFATKLFWSMEDLNKEIFTGTDFQEKYGASIDDVSVYLDRYLENLLKGVLLVPELAEKISSSIKSFGNVFSELNKYGLISDDLSKSIGTAIGSISNIISSYGSLYDAIESKDVFSIINAGIGSITSLVPVIAGVINLIGSTDWNRAATRMLDGFETATSSMIDDLAELSEELGTTKGAFQTLLDDFISEANIQSRNDFVEWIREVHRQAVIAGQGGGSIENLNNAVQALIDRMKDVGFVGEEFSSLLETLNSVGESQEILNALNIEGATLYGEAVKAGLIKGAIPAWNEVIRVRDILADNSALIGNIESMTGAFQIWANTVTVETDEAYNEAQKIFDEFTAGAINGYNSIIAKSGEGEDAQKAALQAILPYLQSLIDASNSYGFSIDDATQALIDQARDSGLPLEKQKTAQEETRDILREIADLLRRVLPTEIRGVTEGFGRSSREIVNQLGGVNKKLIETSDYIGQLSEDIDRFDGDVQNAVSKNTVITEFKMLDKKLIETGQYIQSLSTGVGAFDTNTKRLSGLRLPSTEHLISQVDTLGEKYNGFFEKMGESGRVILFMSEAVNKIKDAISSAFDPEILSKFTETIKKIGISIGEAFSSLNSEYKLNIDISILDKLENKVNKLKEELSMLFSMQGNKSRNSRLPSVEHLISQVDTLGEKYSGFFEKMGENGRVILFMSEAVSKIKDAISSAFDPEILSKFIETIKKIDVSIGEAFSSLNSEYKLSVDISILDKLENKVNKLKEELSMLFNFKNEGGKEKNRLAQGQQFISIDDPSKTISSELQSLISVQNMISASMDKLIIKINKAFNAYLSINRSIGVTLIRFDSVKGAIDIITAKIDKLKEKILSINQMEMNLFSSNVQLQNGRLNESRRLPLRDETKSISNVSTFNNVNNINIGTVREGELSRLRQLLKDQNLIDRRNIRIPR